MEIITVKKQKVPPRVHSQWDGQNKECKIGLRAKREINILNEETGSFA
jgi:hypothetical protein